MPQRLKNRGYMHVVRKSEHGKRLLKDDNIKSTIKTAVCAKIKDNKTLAQQALVSSEDPATYSLLDPSAQKMMLFLKEVYE